MCLWNSCRSGSGRGCPGLQCHGQTLQEKTFGRREHCNLFHIQVTAVSGLAFRRGRIPIDLDGIILAAALITNPQDPAALPLHVLDEDVLPVPLARYPNGNRDVRLADGVRGDQQLLRERVPLLEVLDLLLREIQGRVRLLEHVLQALVRRLAGLETEVADDLVLHLGGELPKGRRGDVKVLRTHLLDERAQLVLGGQARIGDRGPRHLGHPLLEVDLGQSIGVMVAPAVFGLGERGRARCRSVFFVLPVRRFGRPGRFGRVASQVFQIHRILIYRDRTSGFLALPLQRLGLFRSMMNAFVNVRWQSCAQRKRTAHLCACAWLRASRLKCAARSLSATLAWLRAAPVFFFLRSAWREK